MSSPIPCGLTLYYLKEGMYQFMQSQHSFISFDELDLAKDLTRNWVEYEPLLKILTSFAYI